MLLSYFSYGSSQLICFCCCSNRWITNVFAFRSNLRLCWIHSVHFWLSKADAALPVILFIWSSSSSKCILCSLLLIIYKRDTWKYLYDGDQTSIHNGHETLSSETLIRLRLWCFTPFNKLSLQYQHRGTIHFFRAAVTEEQCCNLPAVIL